MKRFITLAFTLSLVSSFAADIDMYGQAKDREVKSQPRPVRDREVKANPRPVVDREVQSTPRPVVDQEGKANPRPVVDREVNPTAPRPGGDRETTTRATDRETPDRNRPSDFEVFNRNPQLMQRVVAMLPQGMQLRDAERGFKNHGQFIAALHAAKNLNISFRELQSRMTGRNSRSLGQAIHDLRPGINDREAMREAEKAERQATATQQAKSS
jgi:hypothetical protein